MPYQEKLTFESDKPIAPELLIDLASQLQQQNIRVYFTNDDSWEKCQKLLMEKGAKYILSIRRLQEAVLRKVENRDSRALLVRVLATQLESLSPSSDLIIEDPYFFSVNLANKAEYLDVFRQIFSAVIPKIASLRIVTKAEYNVELYQSIRDIVTSLNPQINISHKTTGDFHDRFWIADEARGLFVGCSLNGIGKRYALVDFMENDDVVQIVEELRRAKLL
jgi:hypothetical protein